MLSNTDKNIAHAFKMRAEKIVPVVDFLIFGSRARGEASQDSDLDLFIEVEGITPYQRQKLSELAFEIGFEQDCLISTFVATKEQLKHGPLGANPIMFKIADEGIRV